MTADPLVGRVLPFSDRAMLALAACAYETERPLSEWIEWACWVRFRARMMRRG